MAKQPQGGRKDASPGRRGKTMTRFTTCLDPTLLEIGEVLGIQPDTVLQWIIEGRLLVTRQDSQAKLLAGPHRSLKNQKAGKLLILTKKPINQKWQVFSC
jgi:hypothetical protein